MRYTEITDKVGFITYVLDKPILALDIETTGLDPHRDKVTCVALYDGSNKVAYCYDSTLWPLLVNSNTFVLHNAKFDLRFLYNAGINLTQHKYHDTVIYDHLKDENKEHSLDAIVKREWGDNYKEVFWSKYSTFDSATHRDKEEYVCKDVYYTYQYFKQFKETNLSRMLHNLSRALLQTEVKGVKVDTDLLNSLDKELALKLMQLEVDCRASTEIECATWEMSEWTKEIKLRKTPAGKARVPKPKFNFASNKQLGELLYDYLAIPEQKNKAGSRTVDDKALSEIEDYHTVVKLLRDYRETSKLKGAFVDAVRDRLISGRIYPEFNVCGTVTGRLSAKNPNLQQIPRDGSIRHIFVPDHGNIFIDADYSMLEVVIAAHFSQDKNLLRIINEGASKHDITADSLKIERHLAKTLNFAMQYQCSAFKVAQILKCSNDEAQFIWNKYWETYSGEKKVIDKCKSLIDAGLPITTPFGRKRHFPLYFSNKWEREAAYRQGYSSLIQGTGADICNTAYVKIFDILNVSGEGRTMWPVHDEILIEVEEGLYNKYSTILTNTMESIGKDIELTVPLKAEVSPALTHWQK